MVRGGGQSLSTLNRGEATPENSIQVFEVVVLQLLEWLGVEWSSMQIRDTAELLSAEYHWMTLAELKAFTSKIKLGHYGKEWGKLRPLAFTEWMAAWADELLIARASFVGMAKPDPLPAEGDYVPFEKVTAAISEVFGAKVKEENGGLSFEQKEEIYRQEKIKQRQRDMIRNQENTEP